MELRKAVVLATELMYKHGIEHWTFKFDDAVSRFGRCWYRRETITLSRKLVEANDEDTVRETILHEIAHALVGRGHGHDKVWKAKAVEIGCTGERCYDPSIVQTPESKYIYRCPTCNRTGKAHRKPSVKRSCGSCDRSFNPKHLIIYELNPNYQS